MRVGSFFHLGVFQTRTAAPDGEGGTIETWTDLPDPWAIRVTPVSATEARAAGTVVAAATHLVECRYRPDVKIDGRLVYDGREFRIALVENIEERGRHMRLSVVETV